MKRIAMFAIPFLVVGLVLAGLLMGLPKPAAAQDTNPPRVVDTSRNSSPEQAVGQPAWGGTWAYADPSGFTYTRFDGEYYPGDGLVYFMGGRLADNTTEGSVWSWDPATGTYADTTTDLVAPVSNYTMNLLEDANGWGFYLFCGRKDDGSQSLTPQIYYPDTNTAVELTADPYPGVGTCSSGLNVVYNNTVYMAGGFDAVSNFGTTWVFDPMAPSGSRWTQIVTANLTTARAYIMGAVVDGLIYAIGGSYFDGTNLINVPTVEVLNPADAAPVWDDAAVADLPADCSESRAWGFDSTSLYTDPDATPLAGKIVSGCGFWSTPNNLVYVYNTALDYWEAFPSLNTARRSQAAIFLPVEAGTPGLWVWGGYDAAGTATNTVEHYDLVYAPPSCNVLVVDDDWDFDQYGANNGGREYYTSTLDLLGYPYSVWEIDSMGVPTAGAMSAYDAVVWFTGYDWEDPISPTVEAPELMAYMDAGGNVLLSSQEQQYAYPSDPFLGNYFWVASVTEDVVLTGTEGNPADPLFSGQGPFAMGRPDQWFAYWPTAGYEGPYDDEVTVGAGGFEPLLYSDSGNPGATRVEGPGFRSMYLAFPLEWVTDVNDRAEILSTALDWFCAPPSAFELVPPAQTGSGAVGTTVAYTMTILNNMGLDDIFDITYAAIWPTVGPLTVSVPNGASVDFLVEVDVPADGNCYEFDTAFLTATAQSNPVISDTAVIETSIGWAGDGILDGHIYDTNTGLGIENAYISFWLEDLWYEAYTDVDGYYVIPTVNACILEGATSAFGYFDEYGLVAEMAVGMTTTIDLELEAALPVLSGAPVSVELPADSGGTYTLSLANNGSADLYFHISEVPADGIYPVTAVDASMPSGVDAQVYADLAASADGNATFIVYLNKQADLSAAYSITDWSARGQYVLNALRATAAQTQAGLRAELDAAGASYEAHYIVNALVVTSNAQMVTTLAARPEVAFIGPNTATPAPAPVEVSSAPVVPEAIEWNIKQIQADDVWSTYDVTGQGIVIANIDTGVQWDHPALINQYRGWDGTAEDHNYNWWDPYNQSPLIPADADAHGTHTMGTMVGSDDPTNPISATNAIGVAPGATWLACDGFDDNTGFGYDAELLECAEFLLAPWDLTGGNPDPDMRPDIINNSWGGGQGQWWYNQAIYAWRAAGIMGVFSAGNAGPFCGTAGSPGDNVNMMAVGATDYLDEIAGFSSRGPAYMTGLTKPDVSAPGVNIRSSIPGSDYQGGWGGTSMAAPHVAGEAALLWAAVPELRGDVQLTYWIIEQSAFGLTSNQGCGGDTPTDIPNNMFGWGRVDALAAVELAMAANWDIPWLDVAPLSGSVAMSETTDVVLTFDTTGMTEGTCYTGTLKVEYNDPYTVEEFVAVEVCILVPILEADLAVTKVDDPDPVYFGDTITYTIDVVNNGPDAAVGVLLTDTLPAGVTFVSAVGCTEAGGVVTCDLGDLAAAGTAQVVIVVTAPDVAGLLTNEVEVSSETLDTDLTDNTASAETTVNTPFYYVYLPIIFKVGP